MCHITTTVPSMYLLSSTDIDFFLKIGHGRLQQAEEHGTCKSSCDLSICDQFFFPWSDLRRRRGQKTGCQMMASQQAEEGRGAEVRQA